MIEQVADRLMKAGAKVRVDVSSFRAGDFLIDNINEALKWCNTLVVLWSAAASKSRWVKKEIAIAEHMDKRIICCPMDDTELPPNLEIRIYINFGNFEQGIDELIHHLGFTREPLEIQHDKELILQSQLTKAPIQMRSQELESYTSEDAVKKMLKEKDLYDTVWNPLGKGIWHQYEAVDDRGTKTIMDHATNLLWQQYPTSIKPIKFKDLENHLKMFNTDYQGGHDEWRLPTLEEAMSLMEQRKHNKLYLNSIFKLTEQQGSIWTANKFSSDTIWVVHFISGEVIKDQIGEGSMNHVLAVRTMG